MSSQEIIIAPKRRNNKLILDSEEEAKVQAEQLRIQEIQKSRKEQRRKRKEEQFRKIEAEAQRKAEIEKKYQDPLLMFEQDSNSHDTFSRVEQKIKKKYPDLRRKDQPQSQKKKYASSSEESESRSDEDSGSESSSGGKKVEKKKKIEKERKVEKKKGRREEESSEQGSRPAKRSQKVKIEEDDPKERLVKEVAIRWWYCLPEWPPLNYPYQEELKKAGFRVVDASKFRADQDIINGYSKATPIEGFIGVYKAKNRIIDVRPKQNCPSLAFLRGKTIDELTNLLKIALEKQLSQLREVKYQQSSELELLKDLQKQLKQLK